MIYRKKDAGERGRGLRGLRRVPRRPGSHRVHAPRPPAAGKTDLHGRRRYS